MADLYSMANSHHYKHSYNHLLVTPVSKYTQKKEEKKNWSSVAPMEWWAVYKTKDGKSELNSLTLGTANSGL